MNKTIPLDKTVMRISEAVMLLCLLSLFFFFTTGVIAIHPYIAFPVGLSAFIWRIIGYYISRL